MRRKRTRIVLDFYMLLLVLLLQAAFHQPAAGASPDREVLSAADVIASINAYRAGNGLAAYQTNSLLMAAAQAQSDYQASIGQVTHTGPGGTRPSDRVYAIGYGDGNTVWVSEIIYGGINATVADAVGWWKTSQIHNDTMLSPNYIDIGAGVASAGGMVYYTAVTGYITGSAAPASSTTSEDTAAEVQVPLVVPVVAEEPREDGSIVHTVRTGQSLWNIAAVYDVPIETILELNDLTENSMLQIGQEILVVPASEAIKDPETTVETAQPVESAAAPTAAPATEMPSSAQPAAPQETAPAAAPTQAGPLVAGDSGGPGVGVVLAVSVAAVFFTFIGLSFTRVDSH